MRPFSIDLSTSFVEAHDLLAGTGR